MARTKTKKRHKAQLDHATIEALEEPMPQASPPWSPDELIQFRRAYSRLDDAQLASLFGRDVDAVQALARYLALARDPRVIGGERQVVSWTQEQVETLRVLYADHSTDAIARVLCRSRKAVYHMAEQLGLRKTRRRLAAMGQGNRALRREPALGSTREARMEARRKAAEDLARKISAAKLGGHATGKQIA